MLQLVNTKETYEVPYEVDGKEQAVFVLRKLSMREVNTIDDKIAVMKNDSVEFLGGTSSRMKINYGLVDWKGIQLDGKDVPCTEANKELIPSSVSQFLVNKINEDNGLKATDKSETNEKN